MTSFQNCKLLCVWVCIPILVTTFPERLSGTEPLPHTPGAVRPSSLCLMCLRAHVQFCRFDKADATADVQWHCNHRPPHWYHYFPAQSSLVADILVYWIAIIVRTCSPGGSRTLDFLRARWAPYPLGHWKYLRLRTFQSTIVQWDDQVDYLCYKIISRVIQVHYKQLTS